MKKVIVTILCAILLFASNAPFAIQVEASTRIADIKSSSEKDKAARWAVKEGIMKLASNNRFNKNGIVAERELLAAFAKLDGNYAYSTTNNDMMYNHYSELNIPLKGALDRAKRSSSVTRGHFAVIYAAMFGLDLSEVQAVRYLYLNEITTGTTRTKTFASFNASKKLTRGDAAVFLHRMYKKKKNLRVEGLGAVAKGADNSRITIPVGFLPNNSGDVDLDLGKPDTNDSPGNLDQAIKEIQKVDVEKDAL
ncbi:MAG: VWA domain-containing protein, partial [Lysinibacillus sp.]